MKTHKLLNSCIWCCSYTFVQAFTQIFCDFWGLFVQNFLCLVALSQVKTSESQSVELLSCLVWTATWPVLWELEGWGRGCQSLLMPRVRVLTQMWPVQKKQKWIDICVSTLKGQSQKLAGNIPAYLATREYRSSHSLQEATPPSLRFPLWISNLFPQPFERDRLSSNVNTVMSVWWIVILCTCFFSSEGPSIFLCRQKLFCHGSKELEEFHLI